jgi:hypothetical protein
LKQENSRNYLRKITKSMRFLSKEAQEEAYKRGLDVLPEVLALEEFASRKPSIQENRDISRQQFLMGVQRYLIGFYEDSIHYTTMSVELGLLIRLNEELSAAQKEEIHSKINAKETPLSFTFGCIFGMCKKRKLGIIRDAKISQKIDDIIATRNIYIHASNLNSASLLSMKESSIPEIDKTRKELEIIEDTPIVNLMAKSWLPKAKELLNKTSTAIANLDSMEWCTRDRERIRTKKKVDAFYNRIFVAVQGIRDTPEILSQKVNVGLHSGEIIKSFKQENFSKTIALSTINDAFEILKSLGILEQR